MNGSFEDELRDVLQHQADAVPTPHREFQPVATAQLIDINEPLERRHTRSRAFAISAASIAAAAAIAITLATVAVGNNPTRRIGGKQSLAAALAATKATGSYRAAYALEGKGDDVNAHSCGTREHPAFPTASLPSGSNLGGATAADPTSVPARQPSPEAAAPATCVDEEPWASTQAFSGTATVHNDPVMIDTTSKLGDVSVTTKVTPDGVTETNSSGQASYHGSLVGFADTLRNAFDPHVAPIAMMSLASPSGYLNLTADEAQHAKAKGTRTVNGNVLTMYEVKVSPDQMANPPGATPEQLEAIAQALSSAKEWGYTGSTMTIGVGNDGFIHSITEVAHFAKAQGMAGGKVTFDATLSNFGASS